MDKKAIIYARVSTVRQAEDELPIDSQIEQCRKKAEALGASVVRVFRDDGISGRSDSRPAFQEAISYCEIYSPDYFITWSTSRFARNKVDAGWHKRRLRHVGTTLTYVAMDINTNTDEGWILDTIFEFTDELYSRQVSRDTSRSMMKNAREGYWNGGNPPLGFETVEAENNPKRKRLRAVPAEAEVVRMVFDLKLQGYGGKTIAQLLNDRGVLNRGKKWSKTTVNLLLRNEAVIGHLVFGKRKTEGKSRIIRPRTEWTVIKAHEPIISMTTWEAVQTMMDLETDATAGIGGSPHSNHMFTGILKCGVCGSSMQIETAKGRSKRYSYYNCRNAQRSGGCENRRISADEFDDWMLEHIADEVFTEENLGDAIREMSELAGSWVRDRRRRRELVIGQLQAIDTRNKKLYEVLELMGKDAPNLGDLTKRLRANNEETKRLEQQLAAIDEEKAPQVMINAAQVAELRALLVDVIKTTTNQKKLRHFFGSFIDSIFIEGDVARVEYRPAVLVQHQAVHSTVMWLPRLDSNQRHTD